MKQYITPKMEVQLLYNGDIITGSQPYAEVERIPEPVGEMPLVSFGSMIDQPN